MSYVVLANQMTSMQRRCATRTTVPTVGTSPSDGLTVGTSLSELPVGVVVNEKIESHIILLSIFKVFQI